VISKEGKESMEHIGKLMGMMERINKTDSAEDMAKMKEEMDTFLEKRFRYGCRFI
jgi:hypothetical protein